MTAAFDAQLVADTRTPVWLVLLTTTRRCSLEQGTAPCGMAVSLGGPGPPADGARCYRTYATCPKIARPTFAPSSYTLAFTSSDVPLPADIAAEFPNARPRIKSVSPVAQQISFSSSSTAPTHVTVTLHDTGGDSDAGPFDLDMSVRNTTRAGLTMQRWLAQWPNLGHMTLEVRLGFLAEGFTVADWATRFVGTLSGITIDAKGIWTLRGESRLTRLKKELPRRYSSTVKLATVVAPADTTWSVTDAGEIRVGDTLLVTGVTAQDEIVRVTAVDVGASEIDVEREVNGTRASYMLPGTTLRGVLDYRNQRPLAIVQDLAERAGLTEIDAASFAAADLWIGPVQLTRRILDDDQKPAGDLISEILELFQAVPIDTTSGEMGVELNRPLGADETAEVIDDERILSNSSKGQGGETQRLTHVAIVWDKQEGSDESQTVTAAVNGETFVANYFGSEPEDRREKKMESAWLRRGSSTAWASAVRCSHVFALPPRGLDWDASLRDDAMAVGDVVETDTSEVQDQHGANLRKRMIVISRRPADNMTKISFSAQATGFDATTDTGERWGAIAPNATPDYTSATDDEKAAYAFLGDADNLVDGDVGYVLS